MDEGYGRFGSYSRVEMERFFHLDDEDRRLVAMRRRDYNRLGFAVQMVTVRHLGMFLPDRVFAMLIVPRYTRTASARRTPPAGGGNIRTRPIRASAPALPHIVSRVAWTRRVFAAPGRTRLPHIVGCYVR